MAYTFRNKYFEYKGTLSTSLVIYPTNNDNKRTNTVLKVDNETIEFIRQTIDSRGRIKMGACRDRPSQGSLGCLLKEMKKSPQLLSYVLPLLEEEGFLIHSKEGKTYWVERIRV